MTRRWEVLLTVLLLLGALCGASDVDAELKKKKRRERRRRKQGGTPDEVQSPPEKRPNVLILMSDEHSFRVMEAFGNDIIKTPNLQKLSNRGTTFRNAYCANPICVPARVSFGTGMRPSKVGVFHNEAQDFDTMRDHPNTMPRLFKKAGYEAEWLGKEHWATNNTGFGWGEANDHWKPKLMESDYFKLGRRIGNHPKTAQTFGKNTEPSSDEMIADMAIDWLNDYDGKKPFLLGVSFRTPHYPWIVEKRFYDMYKDKVDVPRVTQAMLDDLPSANRLRRENLEYGKMTDEEIKRARAVYYGMVTHVDEEFGRILDVLDKKDMRQDTIVIYLSDHGEHLGEHGLWFKNSFYEDSVKVPLVISHRKSLPHGKVVKSPVLTIDVLPTILELCGINVPKGLDGKSLVPLLKGDDDGWKRDVVSETFASRAGRMVRRKQYKYNWYADGGNQLFDLSEDPMEERNLINNTEYKTIIKMLHQKAMVDFLDRPKTEKQKKKEARMAKTIKSS